MTSDAPDGPIGRKPAPPSGFAVGVRLAVTAMPVMGLFGLAFGAFAAQKGLGLPTATLMREARMPLSCSAAASRFGWSGSARRRRATCSGRSCPTLRATGSIVVAIVVPVVVKAGAAAVVAVVTAAAPMILRGNTFLAVTGGVILAAVSRHVGI